MNVQFSWLTLFDVAGIGIFLSSQIFSAYILTIISCKRIKDNFQEFFIFPN